MPIYENHVFKNEKLPFIFNEISFRGLSPNEEWANWHENLEMIFVLDGRADMKIDGDEISVGAGNAVIINSGELHVIGTYSSVKYCYLIIDRSFCLENYFDPSRLHFERFVQDEYIFDRLELIRLGYSSLGVSEFAPQRIRAAVLDVVTYACQHYSSESEEIREGSAMRFIKPALEYVYENFAGNFSLDDVATSVGISKYHFVREFKRVTGENFIDYVNRVRCQQAARMLHDLNKSVAEISAECGFSSPSYFSRVFRENEGTLPSAYRAQKVKGL